MDLHALEYFKPYSQETGSGRFHRVIALHEEPVLNWLEASSLAPSLCRGWYELASLEPKDRIEFIRDYWLSRLPYHPRLEEEIEKFFSRIDDIGIFLTQKEAGAPFQAHLVYSLSSNRGFFQGLSGLTEDEVSAVQKEFPDLLLPPDYLAFLSLHNGFGKLDDSGVFGFPKIKVFYQQFQLLFHGKDLTVSSLKTGINPKQLIPFYQSFDLPFFQCFWADWYPEQEMGNVYFSGSSGTISSPVEGKDSSETMAFETFTDWLLFYIETID